MDIALAVGFILIMGVLFVKGAFMIDIEKAKQDRNKKTNCVSLKEFEKFDCNVKKETNQNKQNFKEENKQEDKKEEVITELDKNK